MRNKSYGSYAVIVPHRSWVSSWVVSTICPPCFASMRNDLAGLPVLFRDMKRLSRGPQARHVVYKHAERLLLPAGNFDCFDNRIEHHVLLFVLEMSRDFLAISPQDIRPVSVEVLAQSFQSIALDEIHATGASWLDADKSGCLQHLQVLRHSGPADRLTPVQFTHCFGPLPQRLEDVSASWICERREDTCVSHSLR